MTRRCCHLVTCHNTILYLDVVAGCFRHAPLGTVPLNLVVEIDDGGARRLMHADAGSQPAAVSFAQFRAEGRSHVTRTVFDGRIESLEEQRIAIRVGAHYLSADPDGMVRSHRSWCREWERYLLVGTDVLDALALLRRYSWLCHGDRSILTLADQAVDLRKDFAFGPARGVRLTGADAPFVAGSGEPHPSASSMRIHIVDPAGAMHTFSRFNPLVYYALFGHPSFYQCLQFSLASLVEHGRYRGALGVACDRPANALADVIPEALRDRLVVSAARGDRGLFNRYDVDHGLYADYQPILYCDVDVVFDADIADLLIDVTLAAAVCCATETRTLPHLAGLPPSRWNDPVGDYFGRYLYAADRQFPDAPVALGNSGVIGVDVAARLRVVGDLVGAIARRQAPERLAIFGDQPILDYVLHKTGIGNFEVLDRYCRLSRSTDDVPPSERRGMVHFHLNTGGADACAKAALMRAYLTQLAQHLDERRPSGKTRGEAS